MRGLLRDFADRGGTVLLSSHLLAEVEATVDRLVVISGGRVVAQGRLTDLLSSPGLVVRATNQAALVRALSAARVAHSPREDGSVTVDWPVASPRAGRPAGSRCRRPRRRASRR
jgi:ABC-2 type transport system ATP-binding protein